MVAMLKKFISFILVFLLIMAGPAAAQLHTLNGNVKQYDGQGRILSILKYREGHLIRKRLYDPNGQLILDTVYKNGEMYTSKTYYPNGRLKSTWNRKTGQNVFYFPSGQIQNTMTFSGH